jgi:hypothetical protein
MPWKPIAPTSARLRWRMTHDLPLRCAGILPGQTPEPIPDTCPSRCRCSAPNRYPPTGLAETGRQNYPAGAKGGILKIYSWKPGCIFTTPNDRKMIESCPRDGTNFKISGRWYSNGEIKSYLSQPDDPWLPYDGLFRICDGVVPFFNHKNQMLVGWFSKGRKHPVFCYECLRRVEIEATGDLGQYTGDCLNCPCNRQETVIPRHITDHGWAIFHPASLEPPADTVEWIRRLP